jgi:hypothetical protein
MRKFTFPLTVLAAMLLTSLIVTTRTPQGEGSSYAEDRAAIEDLQARYLFAMDFGDPDLYVQLFTEDGILDVGSGEIKGRKAIHDTIARMPKPAAPPADSGLWPAVGRHNISNIVIKVDGDKATGRAYWFHYSNDNARRTAAFDGFGHYEDQMVKIKGQWFFTKRRIYNENRKEWAYTGGKNPAW